MEWDDMVAAGKVLRGDRDQMLAKARDLIDWLAAHPDVPVGRVEISYMVRADSDEEGLAELAAIAKAANLPVAESCYGRHHTIVKADDDDPLQFVSYQACHVIPEPWAPKYRKPKGAKA